MLRSKSQTVSPQLQAQQTEKTIKKEFEKLYHFLRAEEAARVDEVRKEATLKTEAMKIRIVNLTAQISLVTHRIKTIENEMRVEDNSFMLNIKSTIERSQCSLPEPEAPSGALIDETKHLGNLLFTVWAKMKNKFDSCDSGPQHCRLVIDYIKTRDLFNKK
ncbi:E3 ubiquitin-protein ligase TRIM35-like [Pagrus major]|uniref:E3 ubiquitin-protein ligase TRIM35-like n=1 Tax=Pagrus major TaxID=143350 RepID=UPI003CC8A328